MLSMFRIWRRIRGGRWARVTGYLWGKRWVRVTSWCMEESEENHGYGWPWQRLFLWLGW
jgi:hypothetical protein